MNILDAVSKVFSDMSIVQAITSTIFIIVLGFVMRKKGLFTDNHATILTDVVMTVSLPPLAFTSFMEPIQSKTFHEGMSILIWGFVIYILLIFVTKLFYFRYSKDKSSVLELLTIFGSTTFFGIPIVGGVYGAEGVMYASIFNIGYRVFLYSYAYIKMSGKHMSKDNLKTMLLNPIVLATFLGLFLWLFQNVAPQVHVAATGGGVESVAFYRIDATAGWLYKPMEYLADLSSPLAWLAIGSTLGALSIKKAATDLTVWHYSLAKVIIVPLINVVLLTLLTVTHILPFDSTALAVVIIMMATPTGSAMIIYAVKFDRYKVLTANASFISTLCTVVMMPIWIVVVQVLGQTGIFH
jgi:predicted permease